LTVPKIKFFSWREVIILVNIQEVLYILKQFIKLFSSIYHTINLLKYLEVYTKLQVAIF